MTLRVQRDWCLSRDAVDSRKPEETQSSFWQRVATRKEISVASVFLQKRYAHGATVSRISVDFDSAEDDFSSKSWDNLGSMPLESTSIWGSAHASVDETRFGEERIGRRTHREEHFLGVQMHLFLSQTEFQGLARRFRRRLDFPKCSLNTRRSLFPRLPSRKHDIMDSQDDVRDSAATTRSFFVRWLPAYSAPKIPGCLRSRSGITRLTSAMERFTHSGSDMRGSGIERWFNR